MPDGYVMKKLWATAREYNIDSDILHQMVFAEFAIESISKMNNNEVFYIIDRLQGKASVKPTPIGMASIGQKKYINDLVVRLGWNDRPDRIRGYLKKYAGVENIDWLTKWQAINVIEGLKKIANRV